MSHLDKVISADSHGAVRPLHLCPEPVGLGFHGCDLSQLVRRRVVLVLVEESDDRRALLCRCGEDCSEFAGLDLTVSIRVEISCMRCALPCHEGR